jgi:hypothetical protein
MTALEYMEKQLQKHSMNLEREIKRGAPEADLCNIALKIGYYEEAVDALKMAAGMDHLNSPQEILVGMGVTEAEEVRMIS